MSQTKELFMMEMMSEKPQLPISTNKCKISSSQKPKKTIPPSWTKEDLKRQKREEGLFELGYEQGKFEGAKAERERILGIIDQMRNNDYYLQDDVKFGLDVLKNKLGLKAELEK